MTTTVHASSLTSVIQIASNPPARPDLPTNALLQPLVLYIARVPGSRDIFLTPIKPRDRIVTAEDVQSSLYYIHVNSAEDFEPPPPSLPNRPSPIDVGALHSLADCRAQQLPKRPSPPSNVLHSGVQNRKPTSQTVPSSLARTSSIVRKPVGTIAIENPPKGSSHADIPRLPPRPLPTPPIEETYDITPSLRNQNLHLLKHTDHTTAVNPYDQVYPAGEDTWVDPADRPIAGSLTLIRRDPSTHEQWNVAVIHDQPISEISPNALANSGIVAERPKRNGAAIFLDITNQSYAQFQPENASDGHLNTLSSSQDANSHPPSMFQRRLHTCDEEEGGPAGVPQARFGSVSSHEQVLSQQQRTANRQSVDLSIAAAPGMSDRRGKGYSFISPWDSRCEFHTGATGRSLKCRHRLPHGGGRTAEVSELRFNLPTSSAGRQAAGMARTAAEKRGSYLQGLHRKMRSTDSTAEQGLDGNDDDGGSWTPRHVLNEDGRIDLTLGKERAGGGFGGRQAKLGKLIVEPEGLKMLDLLVAANVGLWWRAYERH